MCRFHFSRLAVGSDPGVDVLSRPDLALREIRDGLREVGTAGDLIRALAADPAEADTDLVRTDQLDLLLPAHTDHYSRASTS